jgi:hypothetical protein
LRECRLHSLPTINHRRPSHIHRLEDEIGHDRRYPFVSATPLYRKGRQTQQAHAKHRLAPRQLYLSSLEQKKRTGPNRSSYGAPVLSRIDRARIWYTVKA